MRSTGALCPFASYRAARSLTTGSLTACSIAHRPEQSTRCATCGFLASPSCLSKKLGADAAGFSAGIKDDDWSCPVCCCLAHRNDRAAYPILEEFPPLRRQDDEESVGADAVQAVLDKLPEGPWREPFAHLLSGLHRQLAVTQGQLRKVESDAALAQKEAEEAEQAEVDTRRVLTWKPLPKSPAGRLALRNHVQRRYGEAAEVNEQLAAHRHELRSTYDVLWSLLPEAVHRPGVMQAMQTWTSAGQSTCKTRFFR
ncbi:hypothetical protein DIPPA_15594 [Diplonema papillatum]|nr:hypothetical protein DIPPA_15594 [Diplonema papillatum]